MKRCIATYKDYFKIRELLGGFINCKIYDKVDSVIFYLTKEQIEKVNKAKIYLYEDTPNTLCYAPPVVSQNAYPAPIHASDVFDITRLHNLGITGKGVKIGLIDTGFNDFHVGMMPSNLIRVDFTGLGITHDSYNHGSRLCYMNGATHTYTGSTTPGTPQSIPNMGTAFGATIYSLKAFETGSAGVIAALNYAVTNGIHIVGIALGVGGGCDSAVNSAINAGVIVVASSGNITNAAMEHPANISGIIAINAVAYNNPTVHIGSHLTNDSSVGVTACNYNYGHIGNLGGTSQAGSGNTLGVLGLYKEMGILGKLDLTQPQGDITNQQRAINLLQNKSLPIDGYTYNVATKLKSGKMLNYETGAGFPDKLIKT